MRLPSAAKPNFPMLPPSPVLYCIGFAGERLQAQGAIPAKRIPLTGVFSGCPRSVAVKRV
ncbi:hypothetical protein K100096D8_06650 [Eggerthella lenta]